MTESQETIDDDDDEADKLMFSALDVSELLSEILCVKGNDPTVKRLELHLSKNLGLEGVLTMPIFFIHHWMGWSSTQ